MDDSFNSTTTEYKQRYCQVLLDKKYSLFSEKLHNTVRNGNKRKVAVLLELLQEFKLSPADLCHQDDQVCTILHTALQFADGDYDIYKMIEKQYPEYTLHVKVNTQQSVLHLAVAKQDLQGAEIWLQMMSKQYAHIKHVYLNTPLQSSEVDWVDTCYEAELPLSMAAWNTDHKMVELLLEYGAILDTANSRGETVFHTLVQAAAKEEARRDKNRTAALVDTYHHLLETARNNTSSVIHSKQRISWLLNKKSKSEYTALELAAKLCTGHMYEAIVNTFNIYKFLDNVDGVSGVYIYDTTDIDSAIHAKSSIMSLVAEHEHTRINELKYFIEQSPILDLIRDKWEAYRKYYIIWGIIHFFACLAPIVYVYHTKNASAYRLWPSETQVNKSNGINITNLTNDETTAIQTFIYIFQWFFHIYAMLMFIMESYHLVLAFSHKKWFWKSLINSIGSGPFHALLFSFGATGLASTVASSTNSTSSQYFYCLVTFFGWIFLLFFTRAVKLFSHFTVIILEALFQDFVRVAVVFLFLAVPFSAMLASLFDEPRPEEFQTFGASMLTLFRVALGLDELKTFDETLHPELAMVLQITFVILSYILLFNVLVALLSDVTIRVSANKQAQWHLQKLNVILFIEARLPGRLRRVCGVERLARLFPADNNLVANTPRSVSPFVITLQPKNNTKASTPRQFLKVKVTLPAARIPHVADGTARVATPEQPPIRHPAPTQQAAASIGVRHQLIATNQGFSDLYATYTLQE